MHEKNQGLVYTRIIAIEQDHLEIGCEEPPMFRARKMLNMITRSRSSHVDIMGVFRKIHIAGYVYFSGRLLHEPYICVGPYDTVSWKPHLWVKLYQ